MARKVIVQATTSGVLQALWNVVVWILVVLAEFLVTALLVAPRVVSRKLRSFLRRLFGPVRRTLTALAPRRGPAPQ
jgi:hypothetical protein